MRGIVIDDRYWGKVKFFRVIWITKRWQTPKKVGLNKANLVYLTLKREKYTFLLLMTAFFHNLIAKTMAGRKQTTYWKQSG